MLLGWLHISAGITTITTTTTTMSKSSPILVSSDEDNDDDVQMCDFDEDDNDVQIMLDNVTTPQKAPLEEAPPAKRPKHTINNPNHSNLHQQHPVNLDQEPPVKVMTVPKEPPPQTRQPISINALIDIVKRDPTKQRNLLLFSCQNKFRAVRNVSAKSWAYAVLDVPEDVTLPRFKTNSRYCQKTGPGTPPQHLRHGEASGMVQDYSASVASVNRLFPYLQELLREMYPDGYALALERGHWRRQHPARDMTPKGHKHLLSTTHTDKPNGDTFTEFKCPLRFNEIHTESAVAGPGQLGVILLDQSDPHAIGVGGICDDGSPVLGWFLGPLVNSQFTNYKIATVNEYFRQRLNLTKNPNYKSYIWKPLLKLGTIENRPHGPISPQNINYINIKIGHQTAPLWAVIIATNLAFGLPPVVYPSLKRVDVPQSYAGAVFPYFLGISPAPHSQIFSPVIELERLPKSTSPVVRAAFAFVAAAFKDQNWTLNVSTLNPNYLSKYFWNPHQI
jgi:hypothetical protein